MKEATIARPEDQEPGFTFGDWVSSDIVPFDKTAEYEKHIKPLVHALMDEAKKRDFSVTVLAVGEVYEGGVGTYISQNLARAVEHIPAEALMIPFVQDVSLDGMRRYAVLAEADRERIIRRHNKVTH